MSLMSWFRNLFSRPERPHAELGRNDGCWCGSGKKYKRCHLPKDEAELREARYAEMFAKQRKRGDGITRSGAKAAPRPPENRSATGQR